MGGCGWSFGVRHFAYLIGSSLASIGFIAWGVILFLITGLLTIYFRQYECRNNMSL